MSNVEVSIDIAGDPATVWAMVSDVTRMGEWSPETTGCRWLDGATGPRVGARFKGSNRKGLRRWSTTCTVTDATPGERFGFAVAYGGIPVSHWDYTFTPAGATTRVVESWTDRRPGWMRALSGPVMGVLDRDEHNRRGMRKTLQSLKEAAERSSG